MNQLFLYSQLLLFVTVVGELSPVNLALCVYKHSKKIVDANVV